MKFRYKVLVINLLLLSVSLGLVGYFMIRKNFELARDTQIQNAIVENNLVQASVEYELLQAIYGEEVLLSQELEEIGKQVKVSLLGTESAFYIRYDNKYVYSSQEGERKVPYSIYSDLSAGSKNYCISKEEEHYYVYVTSYSNVEEKPLNIISKTDITEAYRLLAAWTGYFRGVILAVLTAASVIMYLVSRYLTRPLEILNRVSDEIAEGNYDTRVKVSTNDEVGMLAERFNRMAEAVSNHVEELKDMIHRRDQFVADFTHEIKTPMTTIIGYADTLRSMELPREEQIMALSYIFSEGRRLESLSGKLFELIYLRQHELEMNLLHTTDLEREIRGITLPMLEAKKMTLESRVNPAVIRGNKELLITVFINLIDNARKASEEGSVIWLEGSEKKEYYEISVTDQGIGMKEEDARRICDEFYMIDKSRARKEGGAGIGMSLVALILERHRAELSVDSRLGEGTRICVRFQLREEEQTDGKS